MGHRNSYSFKVLTSLIISVFLFTNISYAKPGTETLSAPNNIFEVAGTDRSFSDPDIGENMPAGPESFKQSVRQDMMRTTLAIFFLERIRPWDLPADKEKKEKTFETRIIEALKALRHLEKDPDSAKLLQIILETGNIKRIGEKENGLEIPYDNISIRIFRKNDIQTADEPGGETLGTFYYRSLPKQTKDLKGSEAPETDPVIRKLIEKGKIVEVYLEEKTGTLKAKRVRWQKDHMPGAAQQEETLGYEIELDQLFSAEEKINLIEWMKDHKIRGVPVTFRVSLGSAALGWRDSSERANIAHAGVRDKAIYMGHLLLRKLMASDQALLRKSILDEDEFMHLKGLEHGTQEDTEKRIGSVSEYIEQQEATAAMIRKRDIEAIKNRLESIVNNEPEKRLQQLQEVLSVWNSVSFSEYKFPVENLYPVKKAVVLMSVDDQNILSASLREMSRENGYNQLRIADEIRILLEDQSVAEKWIKRNASELSGRTIWQVSPEIWHEAGGLARVMQYHGVGIKHLTADSDVALKMIEPHYQYRIDTEGAAQKFNYEKDITHPFEDLMVVDVFNISVGGKDTGVQVSKGVNDLGIETYLIRDVQPDGKSFYTHSLYNYSQAWERDSSLPTWEEFSVFYSKAAFEFLQREETRIRKRNDEETQSSGSESTWKAPVIHTNDSQTALVGLYAFVKREEARNRKEENPDLELDPLLEEMIIAFTTHTYNNRTDYPLADGQGDNLMNFMEIPEKYREFLKHYKDGGDYYYSMASGGLRTADWQGAVARTHMEDVSIYDEWINETEDAHLKDLFRTYGAEVDMVGVSNGDNLEKTAEYFINVGKELSVSDETFGKFEPKDPTAEQVRLIKQIAKRRLTLELGMVRDKHYYSSDRREEQGLLDPEQPVISSSGRLVPEKAGRARAFTDHNIEKMVEKGYQVLIYGNVQTKNDQSNRLKQDFIELSRRLKDKRYPGRFIFVPRFSLKDQRMLLAATDIQIQDSDVRKTGWGHKPLMGTEAAGYTEANISACGGLQLAPPRPGNGEGLLKAQGIPIDLDIAGKGNTLIPQVSDPMDPSTWTSEAYLDILMKTLDKGLPTLAYYQVTSIKLSRILNARLTAAEYLRQFNRAVRNKEQKEQKRKTYVSEKKEREEKMKLINQVKIPDPIHDPEGYGLYLMAGQILDKKINEAVSFFLTDRAVKTPEEYRRTAAGISNKFLDMYIKDGSTGELFRRFSRELNKAVFEMMPDTEKDIDAAKDVQLITGQALTVMSWIDRHIPGAEKIRLTVDTEKMATSKKGESFLDKTTFSAGVVEVKNEGDKGFFWRGTEGVKKIGENIIEEGINKQSEKYSSIGAFKDKMVLYLMDHGFIKVPKKIREATDRKRITTMHETAFLNDLLPLSAQMTSTGPGHFQGNGLDIKNVTEGEGIQVNVLYNEKNEIIDVILHPIKEGDWTLALPGYVDYMINCGGLRFNDISISLTDEEAQKFNPDWMKIKQAKINPEIAPVMAVLSEDKTGNVLIRSHKAEAVSIATIPEKGFTEAMGRMFSLIDVYQYKLSEGESRIEKMIELLAEAKEKAFQAKENTRISGIDRTSIFTEKEELMSFQKTEGVYAFLGDNREFLEQISAGENITKKVLRVAVETLEQSEATGIGDFIKGLETTDKFLIQLYYATDPVIEVSQGMYDKYGIKKAKLEDIQDRGRENILTVLPVEKGEEFTPSDANKCWDKLGELVPGKKCTVRDTIVLPVGYNYDRAGLVRSIILGLRLSEIAIGNYDRDHPFVSYTYDQYKDFCFSQGADQESFTLTKEDIFNMAANVGIKEFTLSLNNLIRSLPIVPFNIEEIRAIYERAREAMIRA